MLRLLIDTHRCCYMLSDGVFHPNRHRGTLDTPLALPMLAELARCRSHLAAPADRGGVGERNAQVRREGLNCSAELVDGCAVTTSGSGWWLPSAGAITIDSFAGKATGLVSLA